MIGAVALLDCMCALRLSPMWSTARLLPAAALKSSDELSFLGGFEATPVLVLIIGIADTTFRYFLYIRLSPMCSTASHLTS